MGSVSMTARARALGTKTRNINFIETDFTGQTGLIAVRYSEPNSGVPSNSRIRFQGDIDGRIVYEEICAVSLHQFLFKWPFHELCFWFITYVNIYIHFVHCWLSPFLFGVHM
jgi:hypothetical protein